MRIWNVPFEELDNKRVVAQHNEWHAIAKLVQQGRSWLGWERPEHHDDFYQIHDRIVAEMAIRGYNDYTPNYGSRSLRPDDATTQQLPYVPTQEMLDRDRWHLVCRWGGEFRGRDATTEAREAYKQFIWFYKRYGCQHDEGVIERNKCAVCKRVALSRDGIWLPIA